MFEIFKIVSYIYMYMYFKKILNIHCNLSITECYIIQGLEYYNDVLLVKRLNQAKPTANLCI